MTQIPAEAFPVAVYSGDRRATPDQFRVESSETAIILWLCGGMIGVSRTADDTHLQAALSTAYAVSQAAERYGATIRDELDHRARARSAEPSAAAMRAAQSAVAILTGMENPTTTDADEVSKNEVQHDA